MQRLNFGYLKRGVAKVDFLGRLFGEPNLAKRLQADRLFKELSVRRGERALDFGCGSGYLTVELARAGAVATGIDVNPFVNTIPIPAELKGRLNFVQGSGAALPFEDASFDVVLASEVLPMLPDPQPFAQEIRRVIKPNGRLVVPNGIGPLPIKRAYEAGDQRLEDLRARFPQRFPATYGDYVLAFQRSAGTLRDNFLSLDDMTTLIAANGFHVDKVVHSPAMRAGSWLAWAQFRHYLATGEIVLQLPFLRTFAYLSLLSIGDEEGYDGAPIILAHAT
jgi:SAM-dependent methyltransferase